MTLVPTASSKYIDWHDARVSAIAVRPRGKVDIEICRLEVYEEAQGDDLNFVAWAATLALDGVSAIRGLESGLGEGWIIDGRLAGPAGVEIEGALALGGVRVGVVEFVMNNGDRLSIDCERASLVLTKMV